MPTPEERRKTAALCDAMIRQFLRENLDPIEVTQYFARVDFLTGTVPWDQAPPEIAERFGKGTTSRTPATATDADFENALTEARESRKTK